MHQPWGQSLYIISVKTPYMQCSRDEGPWTIQKSHKAILTYDTSMIYHKYKMQAWVSWEWKVTRGVKKLDQCGRRRIFDYPRGASRRQWHHQSLAFNSFTTAVARLVDRIRGHELDSTTRAIITSWIHNLKLAQAQMSVIYHHLRLVLLNCSKYGSLTWIFCSGTWRPQTKPIQPCDSLPVASQSTADRTKAVLRQSLDRDTF